MRHTASLPPPAFSMAFKEQTIEDFREILDHGGEFAELVWFQGSDSTGPLPWRPVRVALRELGLSEALGLGISMGPQNSALEIHASRDAQGITSAEIGQDKIRRYPGTKDARDFIVVKLPNPSDPGALRFFAIA